MNNNNNATILIHRPDQSGLVATITDFINVNGGNIIELEQQVNRQQNAYGNFRI